MLSKPVRRVPSKAKSAPSAHEQLRHKLVGSYNVFISRRPQPVQNATEDIKIPRKAEKSVLQVGKEEEATANGDQPSPKKQARTLPWSPAERRYWHAKNYDPTGSRHWVTNRVVAMKDNIATSDFPTTCASGFLRGHQSPFEAGVVEQLRSVNAIVKGKTNMDEFGMGSHSTNSFFGTVRPSWGGGTLSAGGSSGGSAVAVSEHDCTIALGTDTGGSVRLPAAYSGVVGFKPSYGIISRWGIVPYANSLDTVGILARSSNHILQSFVSMQAPDPRDPTSLTEKSRKRIWGDTKNMDSDRANESISLSKLKIGVPIEYNITELDPEVRKSWQRTLILLQQQGCTIVPISLPHTKQALGTYYVLAPAEAASNLAKYDGVRYGTRGHSTDGAGEVLYSESRGENFGDEVKKRVFLGSYLLSSDAIDNYFIKAQKVRRLVRRDFDRVFSMPNPLQDVEQFDLSEIDDQTILEDKRGPSQVDFIVCPTAPTPPPTLEHVELESKTHPVNNYINDVFTVPASLAGLPAISVPIPISKHCPLHSMQIIGQYSDDLRVISIASQLEELVKPMPQKIRPIVHTFRRTYPLRVATTLELPR